MSTLGIHYGLQKLMHEMFGKKGGLISKLAREVGRSQSVVNRWFRLEAKIPEECIEKLVEIGGGKVTAEELRAGF